MYIILCMHIKFCVNLCLHIIIIVVSRVSTHGYLHITRNFGVYIPRNRRLPGTIGYMCVYYVCEWLCVVCM